MTSVSKYASVPTRSPQTVSFGAHRLSDRPASAVREGATSMPAAWQTRGVPSFKGQQSPYEAEPRSMLDIAMDPARWAISTRIHCIGTGLVASTIILALAL